jgi:hypothetical protein
MSGKRPAANEIHDGNAGDRIAVVDPGRRARGRRGSHAGETSLAVAQRDALRLDPQNIGSFMDLETADQSPRNPAPDRLEISRRAGAECGPQRCAHGVAPCFRHQSEFLHESSALIVRLNRLNVRPARYRAVGFDRVSERKARNPTLYSGRNIHRPTTSKRNLTLCDGDRLIKAGPAARLILDQSAGDQIGERITRDGRSIVSIQRPSGI